MTWINTLDTTTPSNTDNPQEGAERIREAKKAIIERLDKEHYMPIEDNEVKNAAAGEHKAITLRKQDSAPTTGADKHAIYAREVGGTLEMFTKDAAGNEVQLTKDGARYDDPGVIKMYGGASAPDGWLICDGSLKSKTTYASLFAVLGTNYGEDGDLFRLPDFSGRTAYGVGDSETEGSSALARGDKPGTAKHQLTEAELPRHTHSGGNHNHSIYYRSRSRGTGSDIDTVWASPQDNTSNSSILDNTHNHGINENNCGDAPHENMSPGVVVNYIIKT